MRDPVTDNVTAIDTYNQPNIRSNIADAATQDLILFNSSFVNGTISCTYVLKKWSSLKTRLIVGDFFFRFVRPVVPNDTDLQVDRALNIDSFILYGYRAFPNPSSNIMSFPVHDVTPTSSAIMLNASIDSNQPFNGVTVPVSIWLKTVIILFASQQ